MAKTVCIVGAGPSGLVAAKTLLHNTAPGEFKVTVFDAQEQIGGLWPTSKTDTKRQVHPFMWANQSRHTVQFGELAWDDADPQFPQGWMIGKYLERYLERFLTNNPDFELKLGKRVERAERPQGSSDGWNITVGSDSGTESKHFDYLLVASGFFGKPIIPESLSKESSIPIVHSSHYRDLEGLLGKGRPLGGKILVVGGQMSGVEIAGTVGSHLSSEINSPNESKITDIEDYDIHHIIQRPIWVFPLYTSPNPSGPAAPFLPLDFASYNLNNRPKPLANTQGHITEETAKTVHGIYKNVIGTDQSEFSPLLKIDGTNDDQQPYLAVSEWYSDFVRSGFITLSNGKIEGLDGSTATLSGGSKIENVAAVVVATGFDPSPCINFLPEDMLKTLQHSPKHVDQPVALAFHGTHHPEIPGLGFVGFYRSPYWGIMQMQARFVAALWSDNVTPGRSSQVFQDKLRDDISIQRTLDLRDDPRVSQFPMGDYIYLVSEIAEALSMDIREPLTPPVPSLPHNDLPLDMLTPARYSTPNDDQESKDAATKSLEQTHKVATEGLTKPKFVAHAVFRSLLGTWKLERELISKMPTHPSGHFSGTAQFLLREKTNDGLQRAANPTESSEADDLGMEYLYIEEGEFKTQQGFGFKATRRYIWRYDELKDVLSVWFAKPDDLKRADYLFHEVEFTGPTQKGWAAKSGHLCVDDYYNVKYNFAFQAVNLKEWQIEYTITCPHGDCGARLGCGRRSGAEAISAAPQEHGDSPWPGRPFSGAPPRGVRVWEQA
ncbi:FMO1 Flavin-containing monooxygenase [Fusarium albosuccineum]|uniref:FMO1 Flavin-containing monooxygenase n=1 Tax=Fusarium albosuccineum TaxID=1237068 RepID=A0A8H4P6Z9_9HYPO|nr:FMO1 Flavin-containing monooxygenase [Fusarium albosuccineum]